MKLVKRLVVILAVVATALFGASAAAGAQPKVAAQVPGPVAPAWMNVSLQLQHAYVYGTDGSLLRDIPISSGAGGRTPLGSYRIYSRSAWTRATSNSSVTMQWMTRFNGGIGFHAIPRNGYGQPLYTPLGIRPVSHGCVRMADHDAKWVFDNLPNGFPVNVIVK